MVSIAAFQAVDPGSIPGQRSKFCLKIMLILFLLIFSYVKYKWIYDDFQSNTFYLDI